MNKRMMREVETTQTNPRKRGTRQTQLHVTFFFHRLFSVYNPSKSFPGIFEIDDPRERAFEKILHTIARKKKCAMVIVSVTQTFV